MNVAWLPVAWLGLFRDLKESSPDWEEDVELGNTGRYSLLGLFSMFAVSFLLGATIGEIKPAIWVPTNLIPLSETLQVEAGGFYAFITDIFSTVVAVVPGEENMKSIHCILVKTYERFDWADEIPFALQPAMLIGVVVWGVEHVITGQNPLNFAFYVILCGIIMNHMSSMAGSYLANYLTHAGYNIAIICALFISGGYLKLVVS